MEKTIMYVDVEERTEHAVIEAADLYALGALKGTEAADFEALLLGGNQTARTALDEAAAVVSALAFAAQPAAPSPEVRSRLFAALASPPPALETKSLPAIAQTLTIRNDELWNDCKTPGVQSRVLYVDKTNREVLSVVRSKGGMRHPPHRHARFEEIYMLEGHLRLDGNIYGPGDFIRSGPGSIHHDNEAVDTCMFLLRTSLDDQILTDHELETNRISS